ncbi:hypothetical protein [Paludibacterium denitrificans]|uniref:Uncharacterized protein n=1 Tax=Paludibacterium denitrificans TaxID=2675226 RepID=A0A844GGJ3_9NEIS|nr:hypothetical protein [Paludibacterium denitrificans]MTD33625.1 hypothetical protein [Paludibacterium denitrificans]
MPEIISLEFDTKGVSSKALQVLKTAVSIALQNRCVTLHHVPIADFCELANLPNTTSPALLSKLLIEARKVLGSVEVTDTDGEDEDLPWGSWPIFNETYVSNEHISFEISRPMYKQAVHAALLGSSSNYLSTLGEAHVISLPPR